MAYLGSIRICGFLNSLQCKRRRVIGPLPLYITLTGLLVLPRSWDEGARLVM